MWLNKRGENTITSESNNENTYPFRKLINPFSTMYPL